MQCIIMEKHSNQINTHIWNIRHTPKYIEILATPKHIRILYIDLQKRLYNVWK